MSTKGVFSDSSCPTLGLTNNPPRGAFKSVRTCFPVPGDPDCKVVSAFHVRWNGGPIGRSYNVEEVIQKPYGYEIRLDLPSVASNSRARFISATASYPGQSNPVIVQAFLDAPVSTFIRVTLFDATGVEVPPQDVDLHIKVCECANTKPQPIT